MSIDGEKGVPSLCKVLRGYWCTVDPPLCIRYIATTLLRHETQAGETGAVGRGHFSGWAGCGAPMRHKRGAGGNPPTGCRM